MGTQDPTRALARPWRRRARAGLYDGYLVEDVRSDDRTNFQGPSQSPQGDEALLTAVPAV